MSVSKALRKRYELPDWRIFGEILPLLCDSMETSWVKALPKDFFNRLVRFFYPSIQAPQNHSERRNQCSYCHPQMSAWKTCAMSWVVGLFLVDFHVCSTTSNCQTTTCSFVIYKKCGWKKREILEKKTEYGDFLQTTAVKSPDMCRWVANELAPEGVWEKQAPEKDSIITCQFTLSTRQANTKPPKWYWWRSQREGSRPYLLCAFLSFQVTPAVNSSLPLSENKVASCCGNKKQHKRKI